MAVTKTTHIGPEDTIVFVDSWGLRRAQRIGYTPNFSNVEIGELGSQGLIETVPELITTSVTLDTNDWGSTDTLAMLMGEKATTPYFSGTVNGYVIDQEDFGNAIVDLVVAVREDDTLRRSRLLPNQYLVGFDFTYNVDGVAQENYSFAGDQDHDFVGLYADLRVLRGQYVTSSSIKITGQYQSGYVPYHVTANNQIVSTGGQIGIEASGALHTLITCSNVSNLASDTRTRVVLYKSTPATFVQRRASANVNSPGYAAIMGRQVKIFLGDSTLTTSDTTAVRLQSVNISADLARDDLKELGNEQLVGKVLNIPIRITVTAEAQDSDLATYAKLVGGTTLTAWNNYQSSPTANGVHFTSDLLATSGRKLIIQVFKERSAPSTLLKEITMTGLFISGKSGEIALNSRGTLSWNMQGSYITVSGTSVNPLS